MTTASVDLTLARGNAPARKSYTQPAASEIAWTTVSPLFSARESADSMWLELLAGRSAALSAIAQSA